MSERHGVDWPLAACGDEDPELFFPVSEVGPGAEQVRQAKMVCGRCAIQGACLRWALETGQEGGVWGGLSEDDRRQLSRRQTQRAASEDVEIDIRRSA